MYKEGSKTLVNSICRTIQSTFRLLSISQFGVGRSIVQRRWNAVAANGNTTNHSNAQKPIGIEVSERDKSIIARSHRSKVFAKERDG